MRSGTPIIEALFDRCVDILLWLAALLGISYDMINVWIFCILWPLFTFTLIFIIFRQRRKIRSLKQELEGKDKGKQEK